MAKPVKQKKRIKKTIKPFQRTAAEASARMGLRNICWATVQIAEGSAELTAYIDFKKMRIIPWGHLAYTVRETMCAMPYKWVMHCALLMDAGTGPFYRDYCIPQSEPQMLEDLLTPLSVKTQELTEAERLDHIIGRAGIFTTRDYPFTEREIDRIFQLVRQGGSTIAQLEAMRDSRAC